MEEVVAEAPTSKGPPPSSVTRDASGWEGPLLAEMMESRAAQQHWKQIKFVEDIEFLVGLYCLLVLSHVIRLYLRVKFMQLA